MPLKYKRNYRLLVDTINATLGNPTIPGSQSLAGVKSLEITPPFTIDFDVVRQNLASVNTANITIYNLGLNTRTLIRKDMWQTNVYRPIELWAGYSSGEPSKLQSINNPNASLQPLQIMPRIFRGNVTQAFSDRQGTSFITRLICQDAGYAAVNSDFSESYSKGTPIRQILGDLIAAMAPTVTLGAIGNFPGELLKDQAIIGDPGKLLQTYTGGKYFIDNEKVYCLQDNEYIDGSDVPVLSDENGILGVPQKETTLVRINLIFEPGITVGQRIQLQTSTVPYYNGMYIVKGVSHKGTISPAICGTVTTSLILDNLDPAARLVSQR